MVAWRLNSELKRVTFHSISELLLRNKLHAIFCGLGVDPIIAKSLSWNTPYKLLLRIAIFSDVQLQRKLRIPPFAKKRAYKLRSKLWNVHLQTNAPINCGPACLQKSVLKIANKIAIKIAKINGKNSHSL